ncbi:zinc-finger-containing protein [Herbaspirillum huttiense]|uniref:Zinc-finger-containing protein n=1 Tax=Herbaspirillum huttiense subsp. lycopersici TaxID=3074428 RepID=A0ABU2EGP4_9BURK|nr:zinc-finger-containing protein [Herbaspirillum huttiense]MDR9847053.1 zinc-finger-containing protein [Herbaspirillum huttiense SE1]
MKTPWNPSRTATARVKNPLPAPTACPYCGKPVQIVGHEKVYGRAYSDWPWLYACNGAEEGGCGAYVGLHPFTNIPLGTLADGPTREARKRAKSAFEPLYRHYRMDRSEAYAWLAKQLGIPTEECHVGWSDIAQCQRIEQICVAELRRRATNWRAA